MRSLEREPITDGVYVNLYYGRRFGVLPNRDWCVTCIGCDGRVSRGSCDGCDGCDGSGDCVECVSRDKCQICNSSANTLCIIPNETVQLQVVDVHIGWLVILCHIRGAVRNRKV